MAEHIPAVPLPPYIDTKRAALRAELFSCSQQGYNISMGPLCELRWQVAGWLAGFVEGAHPWETPQFIRPDWVEPTAWPAEFRAKWLNTDNGEQLLTPSPSLHWLNRLRHHPEPAGKWLLIGPAARAEDSASTLPLLKQRAFTMLEWLWRGADQAELGSSALSVMGQLWQAAVELDLPVKTTGELTDPAGVAIYLCLAEAEEVSLARARVLSKEQLTAYGLADASCVILSTGIERWCLALLNRHGVNPAEWPELG